MSSIDNRNPLIDRERIRGASRMIAEGRDAGSVTAEEIQQVAADVEVFRRNHKISRKVIADKTGYSESVISEFLNGKYNGNNGQLAIDLDCWLDDEERSRSEPQLTQFVWTNVAIEIKANASYCLDERSIGLVYGPDTSGFGKTTAMMAIHQTLGPRASAFATFDKVDANMTGVYKKLCQAMSCDDSGTNKQRFDRLVNRISNKDRRQSEATGRKFILLLDQIHNLRGAKDNTPFYALTDLFDATKTGQLWCGTADIANYLLVQKTKAGDESLAQIRRRIFPAVDLVQALSSPEYGGSNGPMCVSADQVREMFAKHKLKLTTAAVRFAVMLGNEPDSGSIGLLVNIVKFASLLATHLKRTSIDVDLLKAALTRGLTHDRAEILLSKISEQAETSRIARTA
ncbi:MAG: hypothetical protein ACTHLZ_17800 [Tepidisphaeraceae bacterium]